jgi:hypothetical protein
MKRLFNLAVTMFFAIIAVSLASPLEKDALVKSEKSLWQISTVEAAAQQKKPKVRAITPAPFSPPIGYSGLVQIEKSTFLVVHDTKAKIPGPRLGTILVQPGKAPVYVPINVRWAAEPPNDVESVCSVPGRENEFLIAESGYWDGKFGRIFHIVLSKSVEQWDASVKGTIALPTDTENIEGIACLADKGGGLTLLLGERGGSKRNPTGKIRWGKLDLTANSLELLGEKNLVPPVSIAAGHGETRACADLYIDPSHQLWSVATEDRGDDGPFRSVIYQAGKIRSEAPDPIELLPQTNAAWTLDGVKVEGIATSPIQDSPISIATDDEDYEGIWRPLFPVSGTGVEAK